MNLNLKIEEIFNFSIKLNGLPSNGVLGYCTVRPLEALGVSDGWGERKGRAMKGEVCQLHKKISLGLRHGFSELLSFPSSYNDSAAIWPLLRLYQLQFKKKNIIP